MITQNVGNRAYLVMARCTMDDVPLRLFTSYSELVGYIGKMKDKTYAQQYRIVRKIARDVLDANIGDLVEIVVLELRNGAPMGIYGALSFECDWCV